MMEEAMDTLDRILDSKIIAISRGNYGEDLLFASKSLYNAGIRVFEVTFEQDKLPDKTCESIVLLRTALPGDAAIGAGTVMNREQVMLAHEAGASFIISPNTNGDVISLTKDLSIVSIPGAMTPTEIAYAHSCGADIVKVFPAGILGVEYFKAVHAPLKHIPLAAVAGVTKANIRDFREAGAVAFGISSSLFIKKAIEERDEELLYQNAKGFISALYD